MRLPEEYDEHESGLTPTVISAIIAVSLFVGAILALVLFMNQKEVTMKDREKPNTNETTSYSPIISDGVYPETEGIVTGSTLRPEDLDFWDKYPEKMEEENTVDEEPIKEEIVENDPATDGKHTMIEYPDGKEEWVLISPYLPKHEYDFTNLVCQSDHMKYYRDGKQISYMGVDISKYQDYVDFVKVKKAGIDFVMLRVGARGYSSGQLVIDDYFLDNIKRATDAGLKIGVYFFSQAITEEEAIEEANLVLQSVQDYEISYPIAFDMEYIDNDTARIEVLSKAEKTAITKKFLDTVSAAGYIPMLYGDKEWLMKQIDLSKMTAYDVWLSQQKDIPDYPYRFSMWQYNTVASVEGIAGYVNLDVSFIDYSEK